MSKPASADHAVHELIATRWSPYGFSSQTVSNDDLRSLFEAARWAPSSYNEQPWRFIVATRDDRDGFERVLSCLVEPNQAWAKNAAALALGIASLRFARNDKPNAHAQHDLGLAVANLSLEASARGIAVHQMAGILPDHARSEYQIPEAFDVVTAIAIGYAADSKDLDPETARRDSAPRSRRAQSEFVFREWETAW